MNLHQMFSNFREFVSNPEMFATRQEVAIMVKRAVKTACEN